MAAIDLPNANVFQKSLLDGWLLFAEEKSGTPFKPKV
jgi:hypothetical protein